MTDKYKIDSHKLMYHIPRVNDWLAGRNIYPIYMEISPSGQCNHRCSYCALDFMEYKERFLETSMLKERLTELGGLGLKSVMFAGEGEPFLHKDMASIASHANSAGVDVAFTTNAALLNENIVEEVMASSKWIKVSINGASQATYAKIHRCSPNDYESVIENMTRAARLRQKSQYKCALGMQLLLLPDNVSEAVELAKIARDIGMDYLVIKPYSQHPLSKTVKYKDVKYSDYMYLADELESVNSENFNVVFRVNAMEKWDKSQVSYSSCLSLPFWSYIDAGGNVWGCSMFLGDERFAYGNIYDNSFAEIWEGEKRRSSCCWFEEDYDCSRCRVNCRMDEVNRYLWELKNPSEHVNFI